MHSFDLLINILIVGLLIPTILYTYRLNKNLNILRQNQSSLAKLVDSLNEATFKAENSIPKLKSVTETSSMGLKEVVASAKELKDDLSFINDRANSLADRLETVIHEGRSIKETPSEVVSVEKDEQLDQQSQAELELLRALRSIK